MTMLTATMQAPKMPIANTLCSSGPAGTRLIVRSTAAALLAIAFSGASPAHALSELQDGTTPSAPSSSSPVFEVPIPGDGPNEPRSREPSRVPATDIQRPDTSLGKDLPKVHYDIESLPDPVRRMRALIIEACRSGDVERLRPLIGSGTDGTQLSLGGLDSDPIAFLRELSGDDQGQEILAILLEVMEAGYVHLNAGEPSEIYVWPYFFALPLDVLDSKQRVELFTLITAGDLQDMETFGAYVFYRAAITPDGRWLFFVAGD